jgi:hypothetical protein
MKSDEILIKTFNQVKNDNFDQVKFDQVIVCLLTCYTDNTIVRTSDDLFSFLRMKGFLCTAHLKVNHT